jgi:FkbM family methyltransferase
MSSIKRKAANVVEKLFGVRIVYPKQISLLFEQEHLKQFFSRFAVDCVFDVGANAGQYAVMLRRRVGYKGPIVSFEPVPEIAARLRARAANDPAWHVVELALDQDAGERIFNVMADSEFSSLKEPCHNEIKIFEDKNKVIRSIPLKVSTVALEVENWANKLSFKRPFLKVDTQGSDLDVIRGAGDTLKMFVGFQAELAVKNIYADTEAFDRAIAFYRSNGFELSAFVPNNEGHFPRLVETDCIMLRSDLLTNSV